MKNTREQVVNGFSFELFANSFSFENVFMGVISSCTYTVILSVSKTVLSSHGIKNLSICTLFWKEHQDFQGLSIWARLRTTIPTCLSLGLHTASIQHSFIFSSKIVLNLYDIKYINILQYITGGFRCFPAGQACGVWESLWSVFQLFLKFFILKRVSLNCSLCSCPSCHFPHHISAPFSCHHLSSARPSPQVTLLWGQWPTKGRLFSRT